MVEIRPYEIEHGYQLLRMNGPEKKKNEDELVRNWKEGGPSFSLFIDGQIVIASGVVIVGHGWSMGEAWTLTTPLFFKHIKTCYKAIRKYLDMIIKENNLKRVQSLIEVRHEWGDRWMKHLGFEKEGILKCFGPNSEDYAMYARIAK